jgi:hypothetical protein
MHSRQRHGVFEGRRFGFAIRGTWLRGSRVATAGRITAEPGQGRFVRPER